MEVLTLWFAALCTQALDAGRTTPRPLVPTEALYVLDGVAGRVVRVRDVDGDGALDLIVPRGPYHGSVFAFDLVSGRTGVVIRRLAGPCDDRCAVESWDAGGDSDQDGVPDLAIGHPHHAAERGLVRVVSGRSGTTLRVLAGERSAECFGAAVAFLRDQGRDGDGRLVVGAPGVARYEPHPHRTRGYRRDADGRIVLVSVDDGRMLWESRGQDGIGFGATLAAVGDIDGDGRTDVAARGHAGSTSPLVILCGTAGTVIARHSIGEGRVLAAGDFDADGQADLIHDVSVFDGGLTRRALVRVLSGRSGRTLLEMPTPDVFPDFGGPAGVGDVDGDGVPDVAIGDTNFGMPADVEDVRTLALADAARLESSPGSVSYESGCAVVRSGRTGEVVFGVWAPREPRIGLGIEVARGPDVDGDGWEDLLVNDGSRCLVFRVERSRR